MVEVEKYYNMVVDGKAKGLSFNESLDSTLWARYIVLVRELTNYPEQPRRCLRRVKTAHAYYSDYRNEK